MLSPIINVWASAQSNICSSSNQKNFTEVISSLESVLTRFKTQAVNSFSVSSSLYKSIEPDLRILTGMEDGIGENVSKIAFSLDYNLNFITHKEIQSPNDYMDIKSIVSVGKDSAKEGDHCADAHDLKNEVTLSFADALVVIWDGGDTKGEPCDIARLIRQALLKRKLVIWVDIDGSVKVSQLSKLSTKAEFILKADRYSAQFIHGLFEDWDGEDFPQLESLINPSLGVHANSIVAKRVKDLLSLDIEPAESKVRNALSRFHEVASNVIRWDRTGVESALERNLSQPWYGVSSTDTEHSTHPINEPGLQDHFNHFDVKANKAASLHRGSTWVLYLFAALAVLCASLGYFGAWLELALLGSVLWVYQWSKQNDWHGSWLSHRYVAEQIRYLRMGYPLLAIPDVFNKSLWAESKTGPSSNLVLDSAETWLLQRILISEGLPTSCEGKIYKPSENAVDVAKNYVTAVIDGQIKHHNSKHKKLHKEHNNLHWLTIGMFFTTLAVVILKILGIKVGGYTFVLICTTFLPAFGAAIHGILTQNEVVKLYALSEVTSEGLTHIKTAIEELTENSTSGSEWSQFVCLRQLTHDAAELMSDENSQWHNLVVHQQTELPA